MAKHDGIKPTPDEVTAETPPTDAAPLIFISHDTRDEELAEAFSELLTSVSANRLGSFYSSDKTGTRGIPYGSDWYPKVMSNLMRASYVVCLLTPRSVDRPWILYEAGYAKGWVKNPPVLGVALGIPISKVNGGPFAQFQNCADDKQSLVKLVKQLFSLIPNAKLEQKIIESHVETFTQLAQELLKSLKRKHPTAGRGNFALCIPTGISGREEFNHELKYYLMEKLVGEGIRMLDYCPPIEPDNDSDTLWNFRDQIKKLADVNPSPEYLLIIWPVIDKDNNQELVLQHLKTLASNGCRIGFINEFPKIDPLQKKFLKNVFFFHFNTRQALSLLSDYMKRHLRDDECILLVHANQAFHVAKERKEVYETELRNRNLLYKSYGIDTWYTQDSEAVVLKVLQNSPAEQYRFIAAANDDMAVGACNALKKCRYNNKIQVVGFDGLPSAINLIKDEESMFAATVSAHPRSCANTVYNVLCQEQTKGGGNKFSIPIDRDCLVTKDNVTRLRYR